MSDLYITGMPGVSAERLVSFRRVFRGYWEDWLSGGKQIDGAFSRDPTNVGNVTVLQPGVVMGRRGPAGAAYAPSILGLTSAATVPGGTSITVSPATAVELVRRIGAGGTFTLTGPPSPGGVVTSEIVTYSTVNTTTGVITATALGLSEVQTLTITGVPTGGTFTLTFQGATTTALAFNASAATVVAALVALGTIGAGGVTGAGGALPGTPVVLTFASVLANSPQPLITVNPSSLTGGTPNAFVTRTTAGGGSQFIAGSFVQPTDGSQNPITFISDITGGVLVTDMFQNNIVVPFHRVPIAGEVSAAQLINWPADPSLQSWLMAQLSTANAGKFVFDLAY